MVVRPETTALVAAACSSLIAIVRMSELVTEALLVVVEFVVVLAVLVAFAAVLLVVELTEELAVA